MSEKFVPLICDDDVVLLEKDTFKVSRLKELCIQGIDRKLSKYIYEPNTQRDSGCMRSFFQNIQLGQENLSFREIQFNAIKNCQLLKIDGKGWQRGKLRISICISPDINFPNKIFLEFCPDQPIELESPLDDIRKMAQT